MRGAGGGGGSRNQREPLCELPEHVGGGRGKIQVKAGIFARMKKGKEKISVEFFCFCFLVCCFCVIFAPFYFKGRGQVESI